MTSGQMIQQLARLFAIVFLALGVLGFVPGITSDYDALELTGPDSRAELFGLFRVSVLQNLLHVLIGVAGLVLARGWESARAFALGAALLSALVAVYGVVVDEAGDANVLATNLADHILHGVLAFFLLQTWVVNKEDRDKVGLDSPQTVG